uniref:Vitrin n=2 Tax=Sus scrofa TaxID=9823 RepID=A0A4X1T4N5_PIG
MGIVVLTMKASVIEMFLVLLVTGIQSNKEMTKKIKRPKFTVPQINCDVKAGKIMNPEFLVKCPAGCQDPRYHVYGTDVYASYSSVCGAAVHSGVLDNSGGKILVRKVAGQSGYHGSYSNGVWSLSLPRWRESFVVSEGKPQKGVTYPSALTYSSSKSPAAKAGKCPHVISSKSSGFVNRQYCVLGDSAEISILPSQAPLTPVIF